MSGKTNPDRDVKVKIPLDPEEALRALLAVDPEDEPAGQDQDEESNRRARKRANDAHDQRRQQIHHVVPAPRPRG